MLETVGTFGGGMDGARVIFDEFSSKTRTFFEVKKAIICFFNCFFLLFIYLLLLS